MEESHMYIVRFYIF